MIRIVTLYLCLIIVVITILKVVVLVDAINKGDAAVKAQVDRLDTKIDDK